jgi:peroxiredoxin
MKSILFAVLAGAFALVTVHAADVGAPAPQFTAKDAKGATVSLSELRGKVVALEWVNFDCPFVNKHYGTGNMQKLQAEYTKKGVTWLTISSSAEGKEGFLEASKLGQLADSKGNKASHVIADGDGKIGKAFGAKTTPDMFIIDKEGKLVYSGAIDSKATTEAADVETADKYFAKALDAVLAGKPVENAKNQSYGCGVKY